MKSLTAWVIGSIFKNLKNFCSTFLPLDPCLRGDDTLYFVIPAQAGIHFRNLIHPMTQSVSRQCALDTGRLKRSRRGFTLVEVLVAATILGFIGLAILTTFGSGFHVYERIQSYGGVQTDALLSLEEIEKNLRNTFPLSSIGFKGDEQQLSFPVLIEKSMISGNGEEVFYSSVGRVTYYLEDRGAEKKALKKKLQDYPQAALESETASFSETTSVPYVKDLAFRYFSYDDKSQGYAWTNAWTQEDGGFPAGINISLTFDDGRQDVEFNRMVFILSVKEVITVEEDEEGEEGEEDPEGDPV